MHDMAEPEIGDGVVKGIFEIDDPNFGNLWTNIPTADFKKAGFAYGDKAFLTIEHNGEKVFEDSVLFHQSFGFVDKGEPLAYNNELTKVALAVSQGSFAKQYNIGYGPEWKVTFTKISN